MYTLVVLYICMSVLAVSNIKKFICSQSRWRQTTPLIIFYVILLLQNLTIIFKTLTCVPVYANKRIIVIMAPTLFSMSAGIMQITMLEELNQRLKLSISVMNQEKNGDESMEQDEQKSQLKMIERNNKRIRRLRYFSYFIIFVIPTVFLIFAGFYFFDYELRSQLYSSFSLFAGIFYVLMFFMLVFQTIRLVRKMQKFNR